MAPRKIILDCDPGQDDAVAILLALASPEEIELLAITTVGGNVGIERTTRNARQVVELTRRRDVPIHAGCPRPFLNRLVTAEHVHGETGLNGVTLPDPHYRLESGHAVTAIIDLLRRHDPKTITLVPTGPLTNIATAMCMAPDIVARIKEIVLMGGARDLGNVTPAAEFNFYVDPHAAAAVFEAGVPITMFGLDVTHQVLVTETRLDAIAAIGTPLSQAVYGFLDFFNRFDRKRYDTPGAPLHDPCPIAYLIEPALFEGRQCRVEIETAGRCMGRSLVSWWMPDPAVTPKPPAANALVMDKADADRFFALLTERLARL